MLEDALDLEADLGIDTVKQVEIFGKVSERFGLEVPEDLKLRDLNTIAKLSDYLGRQIPAAEPAAESPATTPAAELSEPTAADAAPVAGPVKRLIITTAVATAAPATPHGMTGQTILITSGGGRYTAIMAEKVASRGGRAIIAGGGEGAHIPCNWHNPPNVKTVLTRLQESGDRIDGVIHLVPLERYPDAGTMAFDNLQISGFVEGVMETPVTFGIKTNVDVGEAAVGRLADQRTQPRVVDVIRNQHQVARRNVGPERAAGIRHEERVDAKRGKNFEWQAHRVCAALFIIVFPSAQNGDIDALQLQAHQQRSGVGDVAVVIGAVGADLAVV